MIFPHAVTILHPRDDTDEYGDPSVDWTTATSVRTVAWVQPRSTEEINNRRTAVLTDWMAFLPSGTPIYAHDRLVWDGLTFEVDGFPGVLWNPNGPHHVEASLKRITG